MNVRSKSVGESVEVNITCPDDGKTKVETSINIDDIKVVKSKDHKLIVKLDEKYSMKLKYPSLDQFIENNFTDDNDAVDQSFDIIASCIDMVYNEKDMFAAAECTKKELREWVESLTSAQFAKIEKFFETMPKLLTYFKGSQS